MTNQLALPPRRGEEPEEQPNTGLVVELAKLGVVAVPLATALATGTAASPLATWAAVLLLGGFMGYEYAARPLARRVRAWRSRRKALQALSAATRSLQPHVSRIRRALRERGESLYGAAQMLAGHPGQAPDELQVVARASELHGSIERIDPIALHLRDALAAISHRDEEHLRLTLACLDWLLGEVWTLAERTGKRIDRIKIGGNADSARATFASVRDELESAFRAIGDVLPREIADGAWRGGSLPRF